MEKIALSTNLVNAVLSYLGKRPYEETYQLITQIQQDAQASLLAQQQKDNGDGDSTGS